MSSASQIFRLVVKWATILTIGLILVALFGQPFLIEIPVKLAFGWIGFLGDNLAAMEVNPLLLVEAAVCVAALGVGGHWFARWLYREMAPDATTPWRPGWTVAGLGGVLLLFVAGIATIGITHQTAWLFTAQGPLLQDSWSERARIAEAIRSATEARTAVAETFANTGKLPASAAEAGWSAPTLRKDVKSLTVGPGGVVSMEIAGGVITFTPAAAEGGTLNWTCRSTLPPRILPPSCRDSK